MHRHIDVCISSTGGQDLKTGSWSRGETNPGPGGNTTGAPVYFTTYH